jgi:hypothetical protein
MHMGSALDIGQNQKEKVLVQEGLPPFTVRILLTKSRGMNKKDRKKLR